MGQSCHHGEEIRSGCGYSNRRTETAAGHSFYREATLGMKRDSLPHRLTCLTAVGLIVTFAGGCSKADNEDSYMVIENLGIGASDVYHSLDSSLFKLSFHNMPHTTEVAVNVYMVTKDRKRLIHSLKAHYSRNDLFFAINTPEETFRISKSGDFAFPIMHTFTTSDTESPNGNEKMSVAGIDFDYSAAVKRKRFDANDEGLIPEMPFFQMMARLKRGDDEAKARESMKKSDDQGKAQNAGKTGDGTLHREKRELPKLKLKNLADAKIIEIGGEKLEPLTWKLKELLAKESLKDGEYRIVGTIGWTEIEPPSK